MDLIHEYAKMAGRAHEARTFDWLTRCMCIPDDALHASLVGVGRAEIGGKYWQPHDDGKPVLVVPVSYSVAALEIDPTDLVCWTPANPESWYFRTDASAALGESKIERAWMIEEPLVIRATPLDWVRALGVGCCILDWRCPPMTLANVDSFYCPDREYGLRLEKLLAEPTRKHRIFYPRACHAA